MLRAAAADHTSLAHLACTGDESQSASCPPRGKLTSRWGWQNSRIVATISALFIGEAALLIRRGGSFTVVPGLDRTARPSAKRRQGVVEGVSWTVAWGMEYGEGKIEHGAWSIGQSLVDGIESIASTDSTQPSFPGGHAPPLSHFPRECTDRRWPWKSKSCLPNWMADRQHDE